MAVITSDLALASGRVTFDDDTMTTRTMRVIYEGYLLSDHSPVQAFGIKTLIDDSSVFDQDYWDSMYLSAVASFASLHAGGTPPITDPVTIP